MRAVIYFLVSALALLCLGLLKFYSSNRHIIAVAGRLVRDKYQTYYQQEIICPCTVKPEPPPPPPPPPGPGPNERNDLCDQSEECRDVRDGRAADGVEVRDS